MPGLALPLLTSFLGSLPIGMLNLGILLLLQSTTGSFTRAGAVVAAFSVGNGVGLLVQGRLIDRRGQSAVLTTTALLCGLSLALLTLLAVERGPIVAIGALAVVGGACLPAVITCMRILIPELVQVAPQRAAAYALLGTQFQIASIAGPLVVSALLVLAKPAMAVIAAGVLATSAGLVFAETPASRSWHPSTKPGKTHHTTARQLLTPGVTTLLIAALGAGTAAGLASVAIPAVAVTTGTASLAGLLFAAGSAGDLVGGLVYGARTWRMPQPLRLVTCQLSIAAAGSLLACTTGRPHLMFALMFLTGLAQAPGGIAISMLLDAVARKGVLGQSYTSMVAAGLAGAAAGSAIGGAAGDRTAPWVLFAIEAAVMAATAGFTFWRRRTLAGQWEPDLDG
ncbi:MFS transporter [Flindersiella endophytica]